MIFTGMGIVMVIAFFLGSLIMSWTCASQSEMMGVNHNYNIVNGCMIEIDDKWIPMDSYRVIN